MREARDVSLCLIMAMLDPDESDWKRARRTVLASRQGIFRVLVVMRVGGSDVDTLDIIWERRREGRRVRSRPEGRREHV
jgi:hypothetical protein